MVMQVLDFGHILAISLNNISRYFEEDFSSLSSVNKGKGTVGFKKDMFRNLIPSQCW